jgi:hypothetical protein
LERIGIQVPATEREAYIHCWSAIGSVMGVQPDLLPDSVSEAQALEAKILERQARTSEAGKILTTALLQFATELMPWDGLKTTPQGLIQLFLGHEQAQLLGLTPNYGCLTWLIPEVLAAFFRTGERLEDRSPEWLRGLIDRLSHETMQAMFRFFDEYKNRRFYVPPALRQAWGIRVD